MHFINPEFHQRRAFLKRSAQLAFTGAALPTALSLAAIGDAAAFNAGNDYKALVCVFLYGGSDYANTLIPADPSSYAAYQTIRGEAGSELLNGIALAKSAIDPMRLLATPASAIGASNLQYALNPTMTGLRDLFNQGRADGSGTRYPVATLLNCGPLITPITKSNYLSSNRNAFPLPARLGSHNDQQSIWLSQDTEGAKLGLGGEIGDYALPHNSNAAFTCMSVNGNTMFLGGRNAFSFQIDKSGPVKIQGLSNSAYGFDSIAPAMRNLTTNTNTGHTLESEYNRVVKRSFESEVQLSAALAGTNAVGGVFPAPFNEFDDLSLLNQQLRMVARIIAARSALGTKRQVFLVGIGGFDHHGGLLEKHGPLLQTVSSAMKAFYDCTVRLGISDKVTAFTGSDFGRTLSSNGDGTDHGWGNHHFIVGDAVIGKQFYGYAPPTSVGSTGAIQDQWHIGQGRLLPTTSVDQYIATLARWFGVTDSEIATIMPNSVNFDGRTLNVGGVNISYPRNLGFMRPA